MRQKGKITNWNDDKGFGFITPMPGGKPIFIHIKAFKNRNSRPEMNQIVTYDISKDKQGRVCAENALRPGEKTTTRSKNKVSITSIIVIFVFLAFLALSVLTAKMPIIVLAFYAIASLFTFIIYAVDKSAAKNGDWRTPESTLHLLALAGGWPGALIAQQKLRHKSKKQSFRAVFWVTACINFGALIWLLTPDGNTMLHSLVVNIT